MTIVVNENTQHQIVVMIMIDINYDHNHCSVLSYCTIMEFPELEIFESLTFNLPRDVDHFCGVSQCTAGNPHPFPRGGASIPYNNYIVQPGR